MLSRKVKITSLFWIAVVGLFLTSAYTAVIVSQGIETKRMIEFIYKRSKKEVNTDN
jgi:hypothetical protein